MVDRQAKDRQWAVAEENGQIESWEPVVVAVLMDIRRELKSLNRLLACDNFLSIPSTLRRIQRNTLRRKARRNRGEARQA